MSLKEIEAEIRKLTLKERAFSQGGVESLDEHVRSGVDALWAEEAERRWM